ncbi:MAG: nicotinate-nucleotide--dimethylbenzimidazole phosphoribosyltransferase [Gudongella sp.]|nr:nicotinate-nucleotide--dimethylbenzimidazole phosphoribosyltransferase [Gudongella sp.]
MNFFDSLNGIKSPDTSSMSVARDKWNNIAKPIGSLGNFEDIVVKLSGIYGSTNFNIDKRALIVMCADNGVLAQGVAQTPGEITAVMSGFIAGGRSSVSIMAKHSHTDVIAVDMGMFKALYNNNILDRRIASGTADFTKEPAMTRDQAEKAIQTGIEIVRQCKEQGYKILATGEMGIGNTTTSSAIASVLLNVSPNVATGRGAGLSDEGLNRKVDAINRGILINKPDSNDPIDVLHKLGGFDLAGLCGVFLGGAIYEIPVIIDGFISSVAALLAYRICEKSRDFMIPSHLSAEPACSAIYKELNLSPAIHGNMRLGEGTGAVMLLPMLDMILDVYKNTITYSDIGM